MAERRSRGDGSVWYDARDKKWRGAKSLHVDGVRRRITVSGSRQLDAKNELRRLEMELLSGARTVAFDKESVGAFLREYLNALSAESSTLARYEGTLRIILKDSKFPHLSMSDVAGEHGPTHVLNFYSRLAKNGASDNAVKKVHALVHSAFESAKFIRPGFARNAAALPKSMKPKYRHPDVHPLSRDQEQAFLAAVKGDPLEALYVLALDTGMRQGELFALEWSSVNFRTGKIDVVQTLKDCLIGGKERLTVGVTKGKARRTLQVDTHTLELLRDHRKALLAAGLAASKLVFPNSLGTYMRRANFNQRAWTAALERAGIGKFTFHQLRHTTASMLIEDGENIIKVSRRLGHAKVSITLDYYGHLLPDEDTTTATKFGARLRGYAQEDKSHAHDA